MKIENWTDVEIKNIAEGFSRQLFTGDDIMLAMNHLELSMSTMPHTHPHDQITCIIEGTCEFTLDQEKSIMNVGDMIHVPSGISHNIMPVGGSAKVLDIFSPIREDFLK